MSLERLWWEKQGSLLEENTLVSVCKQSLWDWVRAISLDYHSLMEKARMWTITRTKLNVIFSSNLQTIDSPERFIALFFTRKISRVVAIEGG